MPNWCTTNYIARGDEKDIKAFANVINNMPNLLSNEKGSFSRLWLGNFYAAVKGISNLEDLKKLHLDIRGEFSLPGAVAMLCGDFSDPEEVFELDDDNTFRFSIVSAWDRSQDIENLIQEAYPSINLFWSSTDEFGNFHYTYNPDRKEALTAVSLSIESENGCWWDDYVPNDVDMKRFRNDVKEYCPGLDIPEGANFDWVAENFKACLEKWIDKNRDVRKGSYCNIYEFV